MDKAEWTIALEARVSQTLADVTKGTNSLSSVAELLVSPPEGVDVDRFRTFTTDAKDWMSRVTRRLDTILEELESE